MPLRRQSVAASAALERAAGRASRPGTPALAIGALLVGLLALMAASATRVTRVGYDQIVTERHETPPTAPDARRWLGTDPLGRDLLTRLMHGARLSLQIGIAAEILAVLIGGAIGALSGWLGGWADEILMGLTDLALALPVPLLALAVLAAVPEPEQVALLRALPQPGIVLLVLVLGLTGWAPLARLVRGQIAAARRSEYGLAAQALGASGFRTLTRHLLPNCVSPLLVLATLGIAGNILAEAWLSFLGLGVRPPLPSWGAMIIEGQPYLTLHPLVSLAPGIALAIAVLGFNLLGDGLRDRFDPRTIRRVAPLERP